MYTPAAAMKLKFTTAPSSSMEPAANQTIEQRIKSRQPYHSSDELHVDIL